MKHGNGMNHSEQPGWAVMASHILMDQGTENAGQNSKWISPARFTFMDKVLKYMSPLRRLHI